MFNRSDNHNPAYWDFEKQTIGEDGWGYVYGNDTPEGENNRDKEIVRILIDWCRNNTPALPPTEYTFNHDTMTVTVYSYKEFTFPNADSIAAYGDLDGTTGGVIKGYCETSDYENRLFSYGCTYSPIVKTVYTYTRDCKGHTFEYCGGHVGAHTQGIVYSATNEQIAMAGILEDNAPLAMDFDLKEEGYTDLLGKYTKTEDENYLSPINYETAQTASSTGGIKSIRTLWTSGNNQGSFVGTFGLNMLMDGDVWSTNRLHVIDLATDGIARLFGFETDGEAFDRLNGIKPKVKGTYLLRDIFDVDCNLEKDAFVFPIHDYHKYEGWTADNMQLVLNKISMDWNEIYGYDIPWEIGTYTLGEKDIKLISQKLEEQYGEVYTEKRKEAVELALSWVGRGHYNEYHAAHDFLSVHCEGSLSTKVRDSETGEIIDTYTLKENCTAGNSANFTNYIINKSELGQTGEAPLAGTACNPADIIIHYPLEDDEPYPSDAEWSEESMEILKDYRREHSLVYIGTFSEDVELSNGRVLRAGVPITVDLFQINGYGTVFLHGEEADSFYDITDSDAIDYKNYWWVTNPDSKTFVRHFE